MSDVIVGPTATESWKTWHERILAERAGSLDPDRRCALYDDPHTAWSDTAFRQMFLFLYETSLFEGGRWRTNELVDRWLERFGRIDEVLLWHAYPRLGFDSRTQLDFWRHMPRELRSGVCDVLHARGIRVFIGYNPWDAGTYDELADIVVELDADGVMLDTMPDVPDDFVRAVSAKKKNGVVFAPELRPTIAQLERARQSWAQWFDIGDAPSIYRSRWLEPRHRQFAIARWDRSRKRDIVYSFFNGSGLLLWDNVFGSYNPYSLDDRRLIAETAAVFDHAQDLFAHGEWLPLVPTGVTGLDANRFADPKTGRAIVTFRNRTKERLELDVPDDAPSGLEWVAVWGESKETRRVAIEPEGTQALLLDDPARARDAIERVRDRSRRALAAPEDVISRPKIRPPSSVPRSSPGRIVLPGGAFEMRVRHLRRECGCIPEGIGDDAMWGWHYQDEIVHALMHVVLEPFAIRRTAVTNAEFLAFVRASGYRPADPDRFLAHDPAPNDPMPVTHVSLADARAFAEFHGERLPTEIEWQWAAEGAGQGNRFPWGNDERSFPPGLRRAEDRATATPQGVLGLCANAWELTESEHDDGHTRFVMLRGGVHLAPAASEWIVERGPRPNGWHAKYILLSDGLDRSEAISFRTVSKP